MSKTDAEKSKRENKRARLELADYLSSLNMLVICAMASHLSFMYISKQASVERVTVVSSFLGSNFGSDSCRVSFRMTMEVLE